MLYKLKESGSHFDKLEPMPYMDYSNLGKIEKDLENLLATHIIDVLFQDSALMPIFQERALQAEADIYALNQYGDLVIFELKRGFAGEDAMLQALRYSQNAGIWSFSQLEKQYKDYASKKNIKDSDLLKAHQEAFNLDTPLIPSQFNRHQHLLIVGNAANDNLVNAVDYWKKQGLSVEFLPYRVYQISDNYYFEFFALPYDRHQNPANVKGVLFDTNRSYDENAIWEMMENNKVSAYGDTMYVVEYLNPKDIVFFSHKWEGIIAAAEVVSKIKSIPENNEKYCDVNFLTPTPERSKGIVKKMKFSEISKITGKSFFWARTIKVPYLNRSEASDLLQALKSKLSS